MEQLCGENRSHISMNYLEYRLKMLIPKLPFDFVVSTLTKVIILNTSCLPCRVFFLREGISTKYNLFTPTIYRDLSRSGLDNISLSRIEWNNFLTYQCSGYVNTSITLSYKGMRSSLYGF
jgi:hypothetical protein